MFRSCVEEPAFTDDGIPRVTACLWREAGSEHWQAGEINFPEDSTDPEGSGWLFHLLVDPSPEAFQRFAADYYEIPVDIDAVRHVYAHRLLTQDVVTALNSKASLADIADEAAAIGCAIAAGSAP